jgi:hypothetical protein
MSRHDGPDEHKLVDQAGLGATRAEELCSARGWRRWPKNLRAVGRVDGAGLYGWFLQAVTATRYAEALSDRDTPGSPMGAMAINPEEAQPSVSTSGTGGGAGSITSWISPAPWVGIAVLGLFTWMVIRTVGKRADASWDHIVYVSARLRRSPSPPPMRYSEARSSGSLSKRSSKRGTRLHPLAGWADRLRDPANKVRSTVRCDALHDHADGGRARRVPVTLVSTRFQASAGEEQVLTAIRFGHMARSNRSSQGVIGLGPRPSKDGAVKK